MAGLAAVFILFFVPLIWWVGTYNGLVRMRNHCDEAWSNIDTELKRRHSLIPNLVNTVKGYAQHERELFREVTEARSKALRPHARVREQAVDESHLAEEVGRMLVLAESYPDLKADQHYRTLQRELVNTEDRIQHIRRIYNANVRDLNNRIQMFPSSLVAGMGGFPLRDPFEISELRARNAPAVALS